MVEKAKIKLKKSKNYLVYAARYVIYVTRLFWWKVNHDSKWTKYTKYIIFPFKKAEGFLKPYLKIVFGFLSKYLKRIKSFFEKHPKIKWATIGTFVLLLVTIPLYMWWSSIPRAPKLKTSSGNYLYFAEGKDFTAFLGEKSSNRPIVQFEVNGGAVKFIPASGASKMIEPARDGKTLTFRNVYQNIDYQYQTIPKGVKEDIVIREPTIIRNFPFFVDFQGVTPKYFTENLAGGVFYDENGDYIFHFEKPYAVDANGERTDDVQLLLKRDRDSGRYVAVIGIDQKWAHAKARAYPIRIDPTVVHDTSSEFAAGQLNRVFDTGSGSSPNLETYYQELPADENTVGLWHMNDNVSGNGQTISDSSGNGNDGTTDDGANNTGMDCTVSGQLDLGCNFDGTDDYVTVSDSSSLSLTDAHTIEAWINPSSASGTQRVVTKWVNSTGGYFMTFSESGNATPRCLVADSSNSYRDASISVPVDKWTHLACVYDGSSGTIDVYINGELRNGSLTGTVPSTMVDSGGALYIGSQSTTSASFNGQIDEVRVSSTPRSPEEIKLASQRRPYSIFTSSTIDLGTSVTSLDSLSWTELGVTTGDGETVADSSNLVAQWNFNETSGTTANNDAEGSSCGGTPANCDGTLSGFSDTSGQDVAAGSGWTSDNRRWGAGSLMFDGSNDFVGCGTDTSLNWGSGDGSVEAWINTSKDYTSEHGMILIKGAGGTSQKRYNLFISKDSGEDGFPRFDIDDDGAGGLAKVTGQRPVNDGGWHHLVGVRNGSDLLLYVDGRQVGSTDISGYGSLDDDDACTIGANNTQGSQGDSQYFDGVIDSPRIYTRALTSSEILANYNAGQVEFQTRTSADNSTWEAWTPTSNETQILSLDSDSTNWEREGYEINVGDGTDGALTVSSGTTTLDTDANPNGFDYTDVTVSSGATLTATGSNPLIIRATGTVDIQGTLTVNGEAGTDGGSSQGIGGTGIAGGADGGNAASSTGSGSAGSGTGGGEGGIYCNVSGDVGGGAGGASYATEGGGGGNSHCGPRADRGASYGDRSLKTLEAGSGGGGGGTDTDSGTEYGAGGGAGGGAVKISANSISVSGTASANGGNGGDQINVNDGEGGAGGGGSGGALAFEAKTVTLSGTVTATGGTGGSAQEFGVTGGDGGDGRITVKYAESYTGTTTPETYVFPLPLIKDNSSNSVEGSGSLELSSRIAVDGYTTALWHFEETNGDNAGNDIFDATSNNRDGEFNGTNIATAVVDSIVGKTRQFNGTDDYIEINSNAPIEVSSGTVEGWVKFDTVTSKQFVVISGASSPDETGSVSAYFVYLDSADSKLKAGWGDGGGDPDTVASTNALEAGRWYHFAHTWSDAEGNGHNSLYLNGEFQANDVHTGNNKTSWVDSILIGTQTSTNFLDGTVDELRISNKRRDHEEIVKSYNLGMNMRGSRDITSTDLSSKNKVPFYVAADRPGTYLEKTVGESKTSNNISGDSSLVAMWHLDEVGNQESTSHLYEDNGITAYPLDSNINVIPEQWGGSANAGEFDITCPGGDALCYISDDNGVHSTPNINNGVACIDGNSGTGYIMYSRENVRNRFSGMHSSNSDHFACVRYSSGNWQVDNNSSWTNFTPDATDTLVASVDFGANTATELKTSVTFEDASGNNYHGISTSTTGVQGKIGKARSFDGSSEINFGDIAAADFGTSDFTVDFWFKRSDIASGEKFLGKRSACGAENFWNITLQDTGGINAELHNGSTNHTLSSNTTGLDNDKWHHLAFVRTGTITQFYINGQLDASEDQGSTNNISNTNDFKIGANPCSNYGGLIDEVAISDVARSADEIRQKYEMATRTHPITIDFAASLDSGNLITGSGDTSFTVDATTHGLSDKGSQLFEEDKIIVKENDSGTEYIAQGDVTSVNESTGAVTVDAWDSGSTFPGSGFTANATVFKWQREYFDITQPLDSQINAVTNLTLRITDGNGGKTIYLDDLRNSGDYMTNEGGSTISSTAQRYFQYRALISSTDINVSSSLTSVTLSYTDNVAPGAPSFEANFLHDKLKTSDTTPEIRFSATDTDGDDLTYQVQWDTDSSFPSPTTAVSDSDPGFSNITTPADTDPFNSGDTVSYTWQSALSDGTTYFYRVRAKDPGGSNTYGSFSSTRSFTIDTSFGDIDGWFETHEDQFSTDTLTGNAQVNSGGYIEVTSTTGTARSTAISSTNIDSGQATWGQLQFTDDETNGDIKYKIYYDDNGTPTIVPDQDLSGNSTGFDTSPVDLTGLSTTTYETLYAYAELTYSGGSPQLQDWTVSLNAPPNTPTLDSPSDTATGVSLTPTLQTTATDGDGNNLQYKIELCEDEAMTTNCQTFDQTQSQTGWSGQNADGGTTYTSGTQASYTVQSSLSVGTTYYWRSYAIDPSGTNTFGNTQGTPNSFTTNDVPNTPTLDSPADTATNQSLTPDLKTTATDPDSDNLQYKIELCEDEAMTTNCQTFDQTSSQTGWSGQDADGGTTYTSGTQATHTVQSALSAGTTYYWRSYAIDPSGTNTFGSTQGTPFSFTTSKVPTQPTALQAEGQINPAGVSDSTPEFTAICNDPDSGDTLDQYRILVDDDPDFSSTVWDSGASGTSMTACTEGARSSEISFGGTPLSFDGTTYYWKIKFWDAAGNEGPYSTEHAQFTMSGESSTAPTSCRIQETVDDSSLTLLWEDNSTSETQFRIEKNVNSGGFSFLVNAAADATSYQDSAVSQGNTYQYRVRAENGGNTDWCTTDTVSLQSGTFEFKGVELKGFDLQ